RLFCRGGACGASRRVGLKLTQRAFARTPNGAVQPFALLDGHGVFNDNHVPHAAVLGPRALCRNVLLAFVVCAFQTVAQRVHGHGLPVAGRGVVTLEGQPALRVRVRKPSRPTASLIASGSPASEIGSGSLSPWSRPNSTP